MMKAILGLSIFAVALAASWADYPELSEATMTALERIRKFTEEEAKFHTMFWLYTRNNRGVNDSQQLTLDDHKGLSDSYFNVKNPVRFLIHGYLNKKHSEFNTLLTKAYLDKGDFNVIVVDWGALSKDMPIPSEYNLIAGSIKYLGPIVAKFALFLNTAGVPFDNMYLIGHSLGSHISGLAGDLVKPHKFRVIYGLDPAGPKFEDIDVKHRLDESDAYYVETIQTDIHDVAGIKALREYLVYGYAGAIGNASFFPNFGDTQPGCTAKMPGCSHSKAFHYFAATIDGKEFYGRGCKSFDEVWKKTCTGPERHVIMGGEPAHTDRRGIFYVKTGESYPYSIKQAEPSDYVRMVEGPVRRYSQRGRSGRVQETRILVCDQTEGYSASGLRECERIKEAYSDKDVNVIVIDYGKAKDKDMLKTEVVLDDIARVVADKMRELHQQGISYDQMYLIGVKKGVEIASKAATELAPEKINTLFALEYTEPINKNAFKYVESISTGSPNNGHTNVNLRRASFFGSAPDAVSSFIGTITGKGKTKAHVSEYNTWYNSCTSNSETIPFGGEPSSQNLQNRHEYLCQNSV